MNYYLKVVGLYILCRKIETANHIRTHNEHILEHIIKYKNGLQSEKNMILKRALFTLQRISLKIRKPSPN